MYVFYFVLILLAAVLLSNLINHFLPMLSVPIVQILLGVLITLAPLGTLNIEFDLEPELFFVLFLAPLVFYSTMEADKKTMQSLFKPILAAAVGLVLVTIIVVGYFTHMLVPAIPLAAAFALAAALGPTDVVAVEAVARRISLPRRIMSILSGESIINDATGIVCFQFAVIAVVTGSFNLFQGLVQFLILAIGGLLAGIFLTAIKYLFVRWLYLLDIKTPSLHISIGIMTPFIIYMVAEQWETSGILAVFSSGIIHSFYRDRFNPEAVSLNNAQKNVWSVLSFSLDGLVFIILGTQLPRILAIYTDGENQTAGWQVVGYVLLISAALMATRFFWWLATVSRKTYDDQKKPVGKIKSGLIFSVAGARGAVPMAGVLSIPLLLPDGDMFPERTLIILITSGVIVVSLLMTNFILPLLVKQKAPNAMRDMEKAARMEILEKVVEHLKQGVTLENHAATEIITRNYYSRMHRHPNDFLLWEKDVVLHMAEMGQINTLSTERYIEKVDAMMNKSGKKSNSARVFIWTLRYFFQTLFWHDSQSLNKDMADIKRINEKIVRARSKALHLKKDDPVLAIIAEEHEKVVSTRMGLAENEVPSNNDYLTLMEVAANGFYMERVLIQNMMEAKRLSWKTAKEMQAKISMLEAQLQVE